MLLKLDLSTRKHPNFNILPPRIRSMTFVTVTKILKVCIAAVILKDYSSATRRVGNTTEE